VDDFMRLWHETNKLMEQNPYPTSKIQENQVKMNEILEGLPERVPEPIGVRVPA